MRTFFLLFTTFLLSSFSLLDDKKEDDILGKWLTENGDSHIEISKIGKFYYGKIVWLKVPNDTDGNPKKDKNNPNSAERSKGILNLYILKSLEYHGDHQWDEGKVYDPTNGKNYKCKLWFEGGNKDVLNLRGFVGVSMLGRTSTWTRVK